MKISEWLGWQTQHGSDPAPFKGTEISVHIETGFYLKDYYFMSTVLLLFLVSCDRNK